MDSPFFLILRLFLFQPITFSLTLSTLSHDHGYMQDQYHILNGDSLLERFPRQITGSMIVARECLVDGDVRGDTLEELYKTRAKFISETYGDYSVAQYYADTVAEFEKVMSIPENSEINLWFEDDLFCQVNFWFIAKLILHNGRACNVFLIRPAHSIQYGFAGLDDARLVAAFENRIRIEALDKMASLWNFYQQNHTRNLMDLATALKPSFPFIYEAVVAHLERIPTANNPGRPMRSLKKIMKELDTDAFGPVFREFNRRESIYGFGDLQVKRLFDQLKRGR